MAWETGFQSQVESYQTLLKNGTWYWDWTQVSQAFGKHPDHHANVQSIEYIYIYIYIGFGIK